MDSDQVLPSPTVKLILSMFDCPPFFVELRINHRVFSCQASVLSLCVSSVLYIFFQMKAWDFLWHEYSPQKDASQEKWEDRSNCRRKSGSIESHNGTWHQHSGKEGAVCFSVCFCLFHLLNHLSSLNMCVETVGCCPVAPQSPSMFLCEMGSLPDTELPNRLVLLIIETRGSSCLHPPSTGSHLDAGD